MRIVMVASEAAPFVKTGGLADVLQALPPVLAADHGAEVSLFLPYYKRIKRNAAYKVTQVDSFTVELGWRHQYAGIFRLDEDYEGVAVYFVDNEFYFGRNAVYGEFDDGERFAYFSRAVTEAVDRLELKPDIIHCHDWQTALVPLFFKAYLGTSHPDTRLVFTIHNVEYQGWADNSFFSDVLGLPEEYRDVLRHDGALNFMKGAICTCDRITTVSQTYAGELKYSYYAHGLDGLLMACGNRLTGITNGIDTGVFNPMTDPCLKIHFDADHLEGKAASKEALQKELGLEVRPEVPILSMVSRLVGHKGIDLLPYILPRLMQRDIQLVIEGTGDTQYEQTLYGLSTNYPGRFSMNLRFDPSLASRIYAGSDIYLMPSKSEPCGLSQLIAMHYGTVPVVNETGGLKDTVPAYQPLTGEGRGFTFQSYNADDFLGAIDRAITLYYRDRPAWNALVKNDMAVDVSWKTPAAAYMKLYEALIP